LLSSPCADVSCATLLRYRHVRHYARWQYQSLLFRNISENCFLFLLTFNKRSTIKGPRRVQSKVMIICWDAAISLQICRGRLFLSFRPVPRLRDPASSQAEILNESSSLRPYRNGWRAKFRTKESLCQTLHLRWRKKLAALPRSRGLRRRRLLCPKGAVRFAASEKSSPPTPPRAQARSTSLFR
jgi:hypothetical protein